MHIFVVDFEEGALYEMFLLFSTLGDCDDLPERTRNDAFERVYILGLLSFLFSWGVLRQGELADRHLPLQILFAPHNSKSLPTRSLPIREDSAVVAAQDVLDQGEGGFLIDLLLRGGLGEDLGEGEGPGDVVLGQEIDHFFGRLAE